MISNTDDHLRNHAFLYEYHRGWRLSPAYDLNPSPVEAKTKFLSMAIDYEDRTASLDTAMRVIKEFRLSEKRAKQIIKEVADAVRDWRKVAMSLGLSKGEIGGMEGAFYI